MKLSEEFKNFLGELTYPFKMLIWGPPGSGKSTLAMMLGDQIAENWPLLYVSGEEGLNSDTLVSKQGRAIKAKNRKDCTFI